MTKEQIFECLQRPLLLEEVELAQQAAQLVRGAHREPQQEAAEAQQEAQVALAGHLALDEGQSHQAQMPFT